MRILIVEDDRRLADVVRDGLEEIGMNADVVTDGESAVRTAATAPPYDVILLDVMLGRGLDGVEVCRLLREQRVPSAVIMLTALDAVPDRVRGLDAGADDYLAKPFAFSELVARLHAVLRRRGPPDQGVHQARGVLLDALSRRVTVRGVEVTLTRKEFDILELLLQHLDHVLSKDQIHEHVWGGEAVPDSNLVEVHVARLRRKLAGANGDDCISTVRSAGYRFERSPAAAA